MSEMDRPIYLDNNATTPLDSRVLEAVMATCRDEWGNPSSIHSYGQSARQCLAEARATAAAYFGVKPHEIVFTGTGTEAANLLIRGYLAKHGTGHIISTDLEHHCVYEVLEHLRDKGEELTFLSPGSYGAVTPSALKGAIREDTKLIVLSAVNTETGVKSDLPGLAQVAQEARVPLVIDGVGILGREEFEIPDGVSAMFFCAHKLHGPKGIGLAVVRRRFKIRSIMDGGAQESGLRPGTENLPGIVGFAEAIRVLADELPAATKRMETLRDCLEQGLQEALPGVLVNGEGPRICNTSNLAFEGVDGESLLIQLDLNGVAVSHGSACASGALEPSRVLTNMGYPIDRARCSVRFSVSRMTTQEEIDRALEIIISVVKRLRNLRSR